MKKQGKRFLSELRTVFAVAIVAAVPYTLAMANTWTGLGDATDWHDAENWSLGIPVAGQAVSIASGAILLTNETAEMASFTMTGGTLTFTNWTTRLRATEVVITNAATLTLPPAFMNNAMSNRVWIVCSNFTLGAEASIAVNGRGYLGSQGPGGAANSERSGGGSHGGRGGFGSQVGPGSVYGSPHEPLFPGSGGGYGSTRGGAGGGAVLIQAGGTVAVHGVVSANGNNYITGYSGGGSGGAIHIDCHTFVASAGGLLRANGGNGGGSGGGGGGGRIAVTYASLLGTPAIRFAAAPGTGAYASTSTRGWFPAACWGTLSLPDEALLTLDPTSDRFNRVDIYFQNATALTVVGMTVLSNRFTLANSGFGMNVTGDLIIGAEAEFGIGEPFGDSNSVLTVGNNLIVTNGGVLAIRAGLASEALGDFGARVEVSNVFYVATASWVHPYSHRTDGGSVRFVTETLTVENGGGFNAHARGYAFLTGPGAGSESVSTRARGGGHGGRGGACSVHVRGGVENGSVERPKRPGSGGGKYYAFGPEGGGLIYIEAGAASLSGTLRADGAFGDGGGAGGGIVVDCDTLSGQSARFIADGGTGSGSGQGGGGGGRIALHYHDISGLNTPYFSTAGGEGGTTSLTWANWWTKAGEGTVWCSTSELLSEMIDGNRFGNVRFHAAGFQSWTVPSLTVSNSLFSFGEDGFVLNVTGDLTVGAGGVLGIGPDSGTAHPALACGGDLIVLNDGELRVFGGRTNGVDAALGATVDIAGDLRIETGGWVCPIAHSDDGGSPRFRVSSLIVETNGGFKATGFGHWTQSGPGAGGTASGGGGGGGYGGIGGIGYRSAARGKTYGLALAPAQPGSGGGSYGATTGVGGNGGGLVWLEARNHVRLKGMINASGNTGRGCGGGGSGGGILISANRFHLHTNAVLRANGGNCASDSDGNGGGGRIALWLRVNDEARGLFMAGETNIVDILVSEIPFIGVDCVISANAGTGGNPADDGTIHFIDGSRKGTMLMVF